MKNIPQNMIFKKNIPKYKLTTQVKNNIMSWK